MPAARVACTTSERGLHPGMDGNANWQLGVVQNQVTDAQLNKGSGGSSTHSSTPLKEQPRREDLSLQNLLPNPNPLHSTVGSPTHQTSFFKEVKAS